MRHALHAILAAIVTAALLFAAPAAVLAQDHGKEPTAEKETKVEPGAPGGDAAQEPEGIDFRAIFVEILGATILFLVLKKYAFPMISAKLEERRAEIKTSFETLEKERDAAVKSKRDSEARLQNEEREAMARMESATKDAAKLRDGIVLEASETATRIRERARTEAAIEQAKLLLEVKNEVVNAGLLAAEEVALAGMDKAAQARLVEQFLQGLDHLGAQKAGA